MCTNLTNYKRQAKKGQFKYSHTQLLLGRIVRVFEEYRIGVVFVVCLNYGKDSPESRNSN